MKNSLARCALLVGPLLIAGYGACSPSNGTNAFGSGSAGSGVGAANGAGSTGAGSTGPIGAGSSGNGTGGDTLLGGGSGGGSGAGASSGTGGKACAGIAKGSEQIYVDATVTDTITTYSPIALFIMQDRSTSMNTGLGGGSKYSWGYSTDAIKAFVSDPASTGLDVGIGFFPPIANGQGACDGSDCGQPVVPIASLPNNGPAINNAMTQATPTLFPVLLTPTECALRGMINECIQYQQQASEKCVAVLITDGTPTSCDTNTANLVNIVAQGKTQGVTTFAFGLTGSNLTFLDQVAQAGGSGKAIDVSGGTQAFTDALNAVRDKSTTSTSHQVTKTMSRPLDCQWKIPPPPEGGTLDPNKVNVSFTPQNGTPQSFGHVASSGDCAKTTSNAWYYAPDNTNPTQILACPATCDMLKAAAAGATVDVEFGCETQEIFIQ